MLHYELQGYKSHCLQDKPCKMSIQEFEKYFIKSCCNIDIAPELKHFSVNILQNEAKGMEVFNGIKHFITQKLNESFTEINQYGEQENIGKVISLFRFKKEDNIVNLQNIEGLLPNITAKDIGELIDQIVNEYINGLYIKTHETNFQSNEKGVMFFKNEDDIIPLIHFFKRNTTEDFKKAVINNTKSESNIIDELIKMPAQLIFSLKINPIPAIKAMQIVNEFDKRFFNPTLSILDKDFIEKLLPFFEIIECKENIVCKPVLEATKEDISDHIETMKNWVQKMLGLNKINKPLEPNHALTYERFMSIIQTYDNDLFFAYEIITNICLAFYNPPADKKKNA